MRDESGCAALFEGAQSLACAGDARHQCADRNAQRFGRLLIGKFLDCDEVQGLALLFRQREEGVAQLRQAAMW